MTDMNSIGVVVKILETPKQKIINTTIYRTYFRAQFPQVRTNCIVHLQFWGNLARDIPNYYKVNDYILIEGYLSLRDKTPRDPSLQIQRKLEITVLKIYPFLFRYGRSTIPS